MDKVKNEVENRMKKTIKALNDNFGSIRTGRASAALFEKRLALI